MICILPLPCGFAAHPCAAVGCGSSRVAASGGQGGPGGLRFPPRPSLDSPLPLETPPLRYGAVAAGAGRCAAGAGAISAWRRISAVVWEAAGAGRCAAGAGSISALRRINAVDLEAAGAGRCAAGAGMIAALRRMSAVVWVAAGAGRCAAGAGMISALRLRAVPPRRERERARRPSRALIEPGGVYAGFAAISSEGSLPPGEEIASLQIRRPRPSGAGESV